MKNEFVSVVSHELRTPLTSIRLINDILDLERIESGKVELVKQACNVADLMKASTEVMQAMAERDGISLCIGTLSQTLPQLWADSDRLLQLLTNLLSNDIKFSHPGSTVWLTAEIQEFSCQLPSSKISVSPISNQSLLFTLNKNPLVTYQNLG